MVFKPRRTKVIRFAVFGPPSHAAPTSPVSLFLTAQAQLCASADWAVDTPFYRASLYLWLNFHTLHHLFPLLDFSHHPAAQRLLLQTCEEFGVRYVAGTGVRSAAQIYREMVRSFRTPQSLYKEISVYGRI